MEYFQIHYNNRTLTRLSLSNAAIDIFGLGTTLHQDPIIAASAQLHALEQISWYCIAYLGYYVHVEADKNYKIKNCVDSEKTNAELYKRFNK